MKKYQAIILSLGYNINKMTANQIQKVIEIYLKS